MTTCMSCSTIRMVRSLAMRRTSCMVSWVSAALMPAVGSSRHSKRRLGGERDADFEIALLAMRQIGGEFVRLAEQADGVERRFRLLVDVGEGAVVRDHVPGVAARLRGDAHVFQRRGVGQDIGDLVGARDALLRDHVGRQAGDVLAVEHDAPAGRPQHAGQAIEEGALARPVRSDDGAHFVALDLEIDLDKRRQAAETDGQQFGLQDRRRRRSPAVRRGAQRRSKFPRSLTQRGTCRPAGRSSCPSATVSRI